MRESGTLAKDTHTSRTHRVELGYVLHMRALEYKGGAAMEPDVGLTHLEPSSIAAIRALTCSCSFRPNDFVPFVAATGVNRISPEGVKLRRSSDNVRKDARGHRGKPGCTTHIVQITS